MNISKIPRKLAHEISFYSNRKIVMPEFLSLLITEKCNFRCQSCAMWQLKKHQELSLEQWELIAKDIIKNFPRKTFIELNGGEPLLRKDIAIKLANLLSKKFSNVGINSNGSLLTKQLISQLEQSGINFIKLSLYSESSDIHDKLRGFEGAHAKVLNAIKLLAKTKIKTEVGILITSENIHEIPALIKTIITLNPKAAIILQPLDEIIESKSTKNRQSNKLPNELWPEKAAIKDFFAFLKQKPIEHLKNSAVNIKILEKFYLNPSSVSNLRCFAGQRSAIIKSDGKLLFCFKGCTIGNVSKMPLKKLLSSTYAKNERKKIANCQKSCRIVGCNFSRGIKELFLREK
jgi:MoaA/NifB/PqqE/SkfB family radical SAM enzyme